VDIEKVFEKIPYEKLYPVPAWQRYAVISGLAIIVVVAFYFVVISGKAETIASLEQELSKIQKDVQDNRAHASKLAKLKEKIEKLEADRKEASKQLPSEKEIPELLEQISTLGTQTGLEFLTFKPQAEVVREFYAEVPVNVEAMGIDLLSATAHLMYGPKGVGCLYVRRKNPRVRIAPMMDGGGHERGMRSGTVPVPLVVGFGRAAEICREVMAEEGKRLAALRDRLQDLILSKVDEAYVNGPPQHRLPHNLNISFAYVEGESVLMGLNKESALSSGSACTSSTLEPSYVIAALGVDSELAHSSIRFGLHRFSTEEEVDYVGRRTVEVVHRLREMSPLYELAKEGVDLKTIQWKGE